VYILPEYNPDIGSHFYHVSELLEQAASSVDIFLVIEKGKVKPDVPEFKGIYLQKCSFFIFRYFELWLVLFWLRCRGWKTFWVHYSIIAGIVALDINSILGGRNFYWHCGMAWLYKMNPLKQMFFRVVLRYSTLVTGTEGMKQMYIRRYGLIEEKVKVMPNWIHLERFAQWKEKKEEARNMLGIPKEKKVVLFVHHLSKRKGVHRIVPVAQRLLDIADILFLVVGSGPEEEYLKSEIKLLSAGKEKLENSIRLEGSVPNKEIPKYLAAADIFFMPSDEEGFPRSLLEAMAMGVPFVASNVGGIPEIIPSDAQAYITNPEDIEGYANKIKALLTQDSSIATMFKRHAEQYGINRVLPRFLNILKF